MFKTFFIGFKCLFLSPIQLCSFFQNINLDGKGTGYDLKTIKYINSITNLPTIFCSGAGKVNHFLVAFNMQKVDAIAVGNYLNFSEHSYIRIKKNLRVNNINVR